MARNRRTISSDTLLASTLAGRVAQIRELRNMTVRDLARAARITTERVEDLEAGIETWLSATDRQVLAKALYVEPAVLQEVEYRPAEQSHPEYSAQTREILNELASAIMDGARDLQCPQCGSTLRCSLQEGLDLRELPIYFPKAFCISCPFVLKAEPVAAD